MSQFNCDAEEEITSIATLSTVFKGAETPLFCLGTFLYQADEKEPVEGRILVFSAYGPETQTRSSNLELYQVTSTYVGGCVYAFTVVDNLIVAAVNSSVCAYISILLALIQQRLLLGETVQSYYSGRGGIVGPVSSITA